jgi:hypothetical protein
VTKGIARVCVVTAALAVASASAAQDPGPGTTARPGAPLDKRRIDLPHDIVAIGCVVKDGERLLLRDAAVQVGQWISPNVPRDLIAPRQPSPSKTVFILPSEARVAQHVGRRIEVTAMVAPASANLPPSPDTLLRPGAAAAAPAATPTPQAVGRQDLPELQAIKAVKTVAGGCS